MIVRLRQTVDIIDRTSEKASKIQGTLQMEAFSLILIHIFVNNQQHYEQRDQEGPGNRK